MKSDHARSPESPGDQREPLARADAIGIDKHSDRRVNEWRAGFGPEGLVRDRTESTARRFEERGRFVELPFSDKETHHARHQLVCAANAAAHVDYDAADLRDLELY
jgi:hypothetical protein